MADSPVVTLVGPGGIGKTRLADEVARAIGDGFPGGVFVSELSGVDAKEDIEPVVARQLGFDSIDAIRVQAAGTPTLVVLDNCETAIGPAGEVARSLADPASDIVVLATSRMPLQAPGERVVTIEALGLPELDEPDAERIAEDAAREALALHTEIHGPDHLQTLQSRHNLATVLGRSGQLGLALTITETNLRLAENTLGQHHPRLAFMLTGLAAGYSAIGHAEACIPHARRAVELRMSQLRPGDWLTALSQTRLAICLREMGQSSEALALLYTSIQTFESSDVADSKWLALAREHYDQLVATQRDRS